MALDLPDIKVPNFSRAFSKTIFSEPGKTDALMQDLNEARGELAELHADSVQKGLELSSVVADLQLMEEKTAFFAEMVEKTQGVFVPPPEGDAEKGINTLRAHVFGPLDTAASVISLLALPVVVQFVFVVGQKTKFISKTGRVAKMMKQTRFLKVMKFAKGALVLALAVEAVEVILKIMSSKKMNDALRSELRNLDAKVVKGNRDYKALKAGLADARAQRDQMLADVGADTPEDYVRAVNEGLAQLGRQKANFDTCRRMLVHGMPDDMILDMVEGVTKEALADLKTRLDAETRVAAGKTPAVVAGELGLDTTQIDQIVRVVDTRDALVRGDTKEEILEDIGIGPGLLDDADDMLDEALPKHWADIDGNAPLDALAAKLVLRLPALESLRRELQGKRRILAGEDIGVISEAMSQPREDVVSWASALPLVQEAARAMAQSGEDDPASLAAANRLPLQAAQALVRAAA